VSPVFGHGRLRLYLLKLLDESPRHGYDVIRELEDRFMGMYAPSAGTVYPRLARLEAEGLVTHTEEGGRKVYRITDAGRAELTGRAGDLDDLEAEIAGSVRDLAAEIRTEVSGSVRDLRAELKAAAKDVRRRGRHQARTSQPTPPTQPPEPSRATAPTPAGSTTDDPAAPGSGTELGRLTAWFAAEVQAASGASQAGRAQTEAVREVLEVALEEVRELLADRGQTG
jgi:DNA-binding PadR family transcriptional regulator